MVEIIKSNLTEQEAFYWEEKIIQILVFDYGYSIDIPNNRSKEKDMHLVNCTWGGEGTSGMNTWENMTEQEKEERSKKQSEKISGENNYFYGKKRPEHSEKMSGENNYWYGKHFSDEHKRKISEARKDKYYGENHPNYGRNFSEEVKRKMSEARKNWWDNLTEEEYEKWLKNKPNHKGGNNPCARKVICLNTGEIFECIRYASEKYNTSDSSIRNCCNGKYKTAGNMSWMYYDEYLVASEEEILKRIKKGKEKRPKRKRDKRNEISIICLNDKRIFLSIIDASKYYDIPRPSISRVLKGKIKNCGKKIGKKLVFKYLIWNHNKKFKIK